MTGIRTDFLEGSLCLLPAVCCLLSAVCYLLSYTNYHNFSVRRLLRAMGLETGADIEPVVQTQLLDATMALPGVIAAGVPGAGGFDAIFALVACPIDVDVAAALGPLHRAWASRGATPLGLGADPSHGVVLAEADAPSFVDALIRKHGSKSSIHLNGDKDSIKV
jgi:phosphomevalonate kinase